MFRANRNDKITVIDILTQAFDRNQSINYIIPQDRKRKQRIEKLMAYSFDVCLEFGDVLLSDDRNACALIIYPDKKKTTINSILWDANFAFSCVGVSGIKRVLDREAKIKSFHPKEPFTYLWFIGVDQKFQGKGIGSAFLKEIIEQSQMQKRPIYLETSTQKNVPWYKKNGFEIFNELDFTYKLYMLRQVQKSLT